MVSQLEETLKKEVQKFFRDANLLWCHPVLDPRREVVIIPLADSEHTALLVERVAKVLDNKGIRNLLGSTRENLKVLIPIILSEMKS